MKQDVFELAVLLKDLVEVNQTMAVTLEKIVTSFERMSGHIAEEQELGTIVSQFSGIHIRCLELLNNKN